jgi:hypothetical protein
MVEISLPGDEKRSSPASSDASFTAKAAMIHGTIAKVATSTEIVGCIDALFDLLSIFGYQFSGKSRPSLAAQQAYQHTLEHWTSICSGHGRDAWMKFAKYKFAIFFHSHTEQYAEPPQKPWEFIDNPRLLACGTAGRFANRLIRDSDTAGEFLTSINQLKKGCPRPSKELVDLTIINTVKALTDERKIPSVDLTVDQIFDPSRFVHPHLIDVDVDALVTPGIEIMLDRASCENQFRRTVHELFTRPYTDKDRYSPFFPSTAASYVDSVDGGGSFQSIRRYAKEFANDYKLHQDEIFDEGKVDRPSLLRFHTRAIDDENEEAIGAPPYIIECDATSLEQRFGELMNFVRAKALQEPNYVKPIGLAESLKVRVITKGSAALGFCLKPLQKFMWKTLRSHPAFALVGEPVTVEYMKQRLGGLQDGELFLSGDYSNATNELAPWVSECIANEISACIGLTIDEHVLFLRALTMHTIDHDGKLRPQRWGQLMGSVVSFPILCLANAALCRWARELSYNKKMSLMDSTLMINGDDCAMKILGHTMPIWNRITSFCGLSPSVGKYFVSTQFVNINSTNFWTDNLSAIAWFRATGIVVDQYYRKSGYVNMGLLYGFKRSGELVGKTDIFASRSTLGARCRDLIENCPQSLRQSVMMLFRKHHEKTLADVRVPFYVPEAWGGVGLPPIPETSYMPSDIDLRCCHKIQLHPSDFPVGKLPANVRWTTHRYANSRMPQLDGSDAIGKSYDRVYGLAVIDSLFTSSLPYKEKTDDRFGMNVLRRNEKSWKDVLRKHPMPPPLALATLSLTEPPQLRPVFQIESLYQLD